MIIRRYNKDDEELLFELLVDEGDEWSEYHSPAGQIKYKKALESSITYIACENNIACGYIRCREDDGYGIYIYDLLVRKSCRGKSIGKSLMEQVCKDYPEQPVYVMSDVDGYYTKLGYQKEGSIFRVK